MFKKGKFEAWSENGKYYYKGSFFSRTKEITKEQFYEVLKNSTVTSLKLEQNESLGIYELFQAYRKHCLSETSEHRKRVDVVLIEEEQEPSKTEGGIDTTFKLDILESDTRESVLTITGKAEGITGSLTDNGVYFPELYRAFYQLAYNGCLATKDELELTRRLVKGRN